MFPFIGAAFSLGALSVINPHTLAASTTMNSTQHPKLVFIGNLRAHESSCIG